MSVYRTEKVEESARYRVCRRRRGEQAERKVEEGRGKMERDD
jgi:hypothetical protein